MFIQKSIKKHRLRLTIRQPFYLGSSETTREAPLCSKTFSFNNYLLSFQPEHIESTPVNFLEWFIGFSEGDGSFIVSKKQCCFVINQKDIKVLYKIKTTLGFGRVLKYNQNNELFGRYIVGDKQNCERLFAIFNGNIVLKKTLIRFQNWATTLNQKHSVLQKTKRLQLDNAWLSGFIDAEGCFYAKIRIASKYKLGFQVEQKFVLNQKDEYILFCDLKELFKSNAQIQKILKNTSTYYKIELCSMKSNQLLLDYLTIFPCKGQKKIETLHYRRIHGYIKRKEHLTQTGLRKIRRLCKKIKQDRLIFTNIKVEDIVH
jgi:hypothetical protein